MGTAAYLSPEQVSGEEIDGASDVYSLGLIALEALTGGHAFPGSAIESATARLVRPPVIPEWITGGWRMLLTAMAAVDPADRPTAEQVQVATEWPLPVVAPDPARAPLRSTTRTSPPSGPRSSHPPPCSPPSRRPRRSCVHRGAACRSSPSPQPRSCSASSAVGWRWSRRPVLPRRPPARPAPHVDAGRPRPTASAPATVTAVQHTATPRVDPDGRSRSRSSTCRRRPARSGRASTRDTARAEARRAEARGAEATASIDPVRSQGTRVSVAGWLMS